MLDAIGKPQAVQKSAWDVEKWGSAGLYPVGRVFGEVPSDVENFAPRRARIPRGTYRTPPSAQDCSTWNMAAWLVGHPLRNQQGTISGVGQSDWAGELEGSEKRGIFSVACAKDQDAMWPRPRRHASDIAESISLTARRVTVWKERWRAGGLRRGLPKRSFPLEARGCVCNFLKKGGFAAA